MNEIGRSHEPKTWLGPSLVLIVTLFSVAGVFAQAPKSKGKYTHEYTEPKTAHVQNSTDAGKVMKIRGKLYCCKEGIPYGAIISLYKVIDGKERFVYSYLVGANGRFDFRG